MNAKDGPNQVYFMSGKMKELKQIHTPNITLQVTMNAKEGPNKLSQIMAPLLYETKEVELFYAL